MPTCGPQHADLEMTVRGADYIDPATPALVLPKSMSQRSPEHALWFGVLELAVREIMSSEHRKLVKHAVQWVIQPTRERGSFLWITDHLQMPGEQLQTRLAKIGLRRLRELARLKECSRAK